MGFLTMMLNVFFMFHVQTKPLLRGHQAEQKEFASENRWITRHWGASLR